MTDEKTHKWELEGVGKAPFQYVGFCSIPSTTLAEKNPSAYMNAMRELPRNIGVGTCAVCGASLTYNYILMDADGKRFVVGSECVMKASDDKMLISRVKHEESKRRAAVREEKRRAACELRLQEQRERNGGKTDYELRLEAEAAAAEARRQAGLKYEEVANILADGNNGFRDSVARDLREGKVPRGRGLEITIEICAKRSGRKGSEAYEAEAARIAGILGVS